METTQTANVDAKPRLSRRRKLLFALLAFVIMLVGIEALARVGSYVFSGLNPYYLFYGFRSWKTNEGHSDKRNGYFKFPVNSTIKFGTPEPARINNHGFRGADFDTQKAPKTFRVICLGASSTFGYTNRDAGTYPAILQELFRERGLGKTVEVLNCGVPHMNSDNILAMFREEILSYSPDLVTFYEGYNDASWPLDVNRLQRVMSWMDEYSAAYACLRKGVSAVGGKMHERWNKYGAQVSGTAAEHQLQLHVAMTRANLTEILRLAQQQHVQVVFVRQPIRRPSDLPKEAPPSFEDAYREIHQQLVDTGQINGLDITFYIHHALLELQGELARDWKLPIVDNVSLVDGHPKSLVTQVHLSEEANRRLAEAIYQAIEPFVSREESGN